MQRHAREHLSSAEAAGDRVTGSQSILSTIDLLQTIATNGSRVCSTCTARREERGEVYFRKGAVVDAEVGRLSGSDAVYRLLSWTDGHVRDRVAEHPPPRHRRPRRARAVDGGHAAARRVDADAHDLPPLDTVFEVDYRLLAERLADIPDEVNGILRLFDGVRTFLQVIDDCGLPDLDAADRSSASSTAKAIVRDVEVQAGEPKRPRSRARRVADRLRRPLRGAGGRGPRGDRRTVRARADEGGDPSPADRTGRALDEPPHEAVAASCSERFADRLHAEGETCTLRTSRARHVSRGAGGGDPVSDRRRPRFAQTLVSPSGGPAAAQPWPGRSPPRVAPTSTAARAARLRLRPPAWCRPAPTHGCVSTRRCRPWPRRRCAGPASSPPAGRHRSGRRRIPRSTRSWHRAGGPAAGVVTAARRSPRRRAAPPRRGRRARRAPVATDEPHPPAARLLAGPGAAVLRLRLALDERGGRDPQQSHTAPTPSRSWALPSRIPRPDLVGVAAVVAVAAIFIVRVRPIRARRPSRRPPSPRRRPRPAAAAARAAAPGSEFADRAGAGAGRAARRSRRRTPPRRRRPSPRPRAPAAVAAAAPAGGRTGPAAESPEFAQLLGACQEAFTARPHARTRPPICAAAKDADPESAEGALAAVARRVQPQPPQGRADLGREGDQDRSQACRRLRHHRRRPAGGGPQRARRRRAYKKYLELAPKGQYASDLRAILETL